MLTLRRKKDRYAIDHIQEKDGHRVAYSFSHDFLPESVLVHMLSLNVFKETEDTIYLLTEKQDKAILNVLKKLQGERNSGYIFSEHLQKTYLVELIHLITKIHHSGLLMRSSA
ncbi:MAG TPA: hypothetical protein VIU12_27040 [Chryseolinea sp.]